MHLRDIEPAGVTFDPPHLALIAQAFGAAAALATDSDQLEVALAGSFKAQRPTLIEARF